MGLHFDTSTAQVVDTPKYLEGTVFGGTIVTEPFSEIDVDTKKRLQNLADKQKVSRSFDCESVQSLNKGNLIDLNYRNADSSKSFYRVAQVEFYDRIYDTNLERDVQYFNMLLEPIYPQGSLVLISGNEHDSSGTSIPVPENVYTKPNWDSVTQSLDLSTELPVESVLYEKHNFSETDKQIRKFRLLFDDVIVKYCPQIKTGVISCTL